MAGAPNPNQAKGKGNFRVGVIAVAVIAAAIGVYLYRSPQADGARTVIVRIARAFGRLVGYRDRARKPIEVVIREIEHGDEVTRAHTIAFLDDDLTKPAEFVRVFPYLIRATRDESEMVRDSVPFALDRLIRRFGGDVSPTDGRKFEESLAGLLNDSSSIHRASAARFLRTLAAIRQLDAPPPQLVECLDDESDEVRAAAAASLVEYGQGPELFLPIALRRLPTERPIVFNELTRILWNLRFPPVVLPLLIEGLSSDNMLVCVSAATVINHMGLDAKPARPAVMASLRRELETPHLKLDLRLMDWGDGSAVPKSGVSLVIVGFDRNGKLHFRIFGAAFERITDTDESKLPAQSGAISALKKQLPTLSPPHALSLAEKTQVITAVTSIVGQTGLNDAIKYSVDIIEQTSEALMQISPDGDSLPGTLEILCEVLKRPNEMGRLGAAWSLGLLGRSARPAVPLLISAFETAPKDSNQLRGRIAMALAQISQGTPDADRVSASLAKAWNTAQPNLKNAIAQALRTLGPKSEHLVPELREMPRRDLWPKIQRGYSPRSFLGEANRVRNE